MYYTMRRAAPQGTSALRAAGCPAHKKNRITIGDPVIGTP